MIHLTADDEMLLKDLGLFVEPVEITDAGGKLLGLFVPANLERGKQIYAQAAARTDLAEIERRERTETTGRSTQEVLERLGQGSPKGATVPAAEQAVSSTPFPTPAE
jgi:hypothetical protein